MSLAETVFHHSEDESCVEYNVSEQLAQRVQLGTVIQANASIFVVASETNNVYFILESITAAK